MGDVRGSLGTSLADEKLEDNPISVRGFLSHASTRFVAQTGSSSKHEENHGADTVVYKIGGYGVN